MYIQTVIITKNKPLQSAKIPDAEFYLVTMNDFLYIPL